MSHERLNTAVDNTKRSDSDKNITNPGLYYEQDKTNYSHVNTDNEDLGPLPPKWEKAVTENGEVYFIEYVTLLCHNFYKHIQLYIYL